MQDRWQARERRPAKTRIVLKTAAQDVRLHAAATKSQEPGRLLSLGLQDTQDRDGTTADRVEQTMTRPMRENDEISTGDLEPLPRGAHL
jgi:hypothetical protein